MNKYHEQLIQFEETSDSYLDYLDNLKTAHGVTQIDEFTNNIDNNEMKFGDNWIEEIDISDDEEKKDSSFKKNFDFWDKKIKEKRITRTQTQFANNRQSVMDTKSDTNEFKRRSSISNVLTSFINKDSYKDDDKIELSDNEIKKELGSNRHTKKKDFKTILEKKIKYVVLIINNNDKFINETFNLLGLVKKESLKNDIEFGCSFFIYPQKSYIFRSLMFQQPPVIQQSIMKVHHYNFEFIPINKNLISLELNDLTKDLYIRNDSTMVNLMSGYLYKINFIFGKINNYIYKGKVAEEVVKKFINNVWLSEIAEYEDKSNFKKIREWVNSDFALHENLIDEKKNIDKKYRADGVIEQINSKVSENYLIDIPRNDDGEIVRDKLIEFLGSKTKFEDYRKCSTGKRKTFLHHSNKIDITALSKIFIQNKKNKQKKLNKKFEFNKRKFKKRERHFTIETFSGSYDSHSDSDDFDPNAHLFSENQGANYKESSWLFQNFDMMIVFDRGCDMVTPFVSQTSYFGLIDDLLKSNSCNYKFK